MSLYFVYSDNNDILGGQNTMVVDSAVDKNMTSVYFVLYFKHILTFPRLWGESSRNKDFRLACKD